MVKDNIVYYILSSHSSPLMGFGDGGWRGWKRDGWRVESRRDGVNVEGGEERGRVTKPYMWRTYRSIDTQCRNLLTKKR